MQQCFFRAVLLVSISCILLSCWDDSDTGHFEPVLYEAGNIKVIELRGTYREMGRQYGSLLKDELQEFYALAIEDFYIGQVGFTFEWLRAGSQEEFDLYPERFRQILRGMAETSGMTLDQLMILDELIVIAAIAGDYEACSAISTWGDYTDNNTLVFGRNFDWFEYFKNFSEYMAVVVYNPVDGSIPTASFGYIGQIQTLNGLNKNGIFLELNAGNLSDPNISTEPLPQTMIQLLSFLFDSADLTQLHDRFISSQTDIAFIINVADKDRAHSFEWATYGVEKREGDNEGLLVATNHFVHPDWALPLPAEDHSSMVRRNNLLSLGERNRGQFNAQKMMEILDIGVEDGGATKSADTIFQLVAVPEELTLWVKIPDFQGWTKIDLNNSLD